MDPKHLNNPDAKLSLFGYERGYAVIDDWAGG